MSTTKTAEEQQNELMELLTLSMELLNITKERGLEVQQEAVESSLEFLIHHHGRRIKWWVECACLSDGVYLCLAWCSTPAYDEETGDDGHVLEITTTDLLGHKAPEIKKEAGIPDYIAACLPQGDDVLWNRKAYRELFRKLLNMEES